MRFFGCSTLHQAVTTPIRKSGRDMRSAALPTGACTLNAGAGGKSIFLAKRKEPMDKPAGLQSKMTLSAPPPPWGTL
jgi:hypothetical protein